MKAITDNAGAKLRATLDQANAPEVRCVRLVFLKGCWEMKTDTQRPSDRVFEHRGRDVLLVDPEAAIWSGGKTLDYDDGDFCFV